MVNSIHYNTINEMMNGKMHITENIEPGMCGTEFVGSDRYRVVVVDVINAKTILVSMMRDIDSVLIYTDEQGVQRLPLECLDKYRNISYGFYGHPVVYTLRRNNRWLPKGDGMWDTCNIQIGRAEEYRDPCF